MEGHGRESLIDSVDVSQTVGWCTTVFPVNFIAPDVERWAQPLDALRLVKEQFRLLPHSGLSHGLLMYLGDSTDVTNRLKAAPRSQLLFNYLGREETLSRQGEPFKLVDDRFGTVRDTANQRAYLLELNMVIRDDLLTIDWAYCPQIHAPELIARLADELLANVTELIDCVTDVASVVTPTDFPMADLDQASLDSLSSQLDDLDDD